MQQQNILISNIPAIIWGSTSTNVYLFVHGKMSNKQEAIRLAEIAESNSFQVLSFDLPEHGDRTDGYSCTGQNIVHDLSVIIQYVKSRWKTINLFGCSLGAYFSMVAFSEIRFNKCLFLSPILDMKLLIENMMMWSNVTEQILFDKKEIIISSNDVLSWVYYKYVKDNPILKWNSPTCIMYGGNDKLTELATVNNFVNQFKCNLQVIPTGEHYLHTDEEIEIINKWIIDNF